MTNTPTPWPFVASIVVLALSASGIILLVPGIVRSDGGQHLGLLTALVIVAVAATVGTRRWKPAPTRTDQ